MGYGAPAFFDGLADVKKNHLGTYFSATVKEIILKNSAVESSFEYTTSFYLLFTCFFLEYITLQEDGQVVIGNDTL